MVKKRSIRGEQGFTMIELLISMFLLSIVMTAVFSFLWGASRYWETGQAAADVTDNARMGLNRMTRELKQASEVTATSPYLVFNVDFGTGDEVVTYGFTPPSVDVPGILWRESSLAPGERATLVNNIDYLTLEYYGNDYRCDADNDGEVIWSELQAVACSTAPESKISRVDIRMIMATGNSSQREFFGQGWLRNRNTVDA